MTFSTSSIDVSCGTFLLTSTGLNLVSDAVSIDLFRDAALDAFSGEFQHSVSLKIARGSSTSHCSGKDTHAHFDNVGKLAQNLPLHFLVVICLYLGISLSKAEGSDIVAQVRLLCLCCLGTHHESNVPSFAAAEVLNRARVIRIQRIQRETDVSFQCGDVRSE